MTLHRSFVTGKFIDAIEAYHEEKDYEDAIKRQDRKLLSQPCRPALVVIDDQQPEEYEDSNFDTGVPNHFKQHVTFKKEEL